MRSFSLILICILLVSCNMGRHYALKRMGQGKAPISNDDVYTHTPVNKAPAHGPFDPGNDSPPAVKPHSATQLNAPPITGLVKYTHVPPDTLLSNKTKHKPTGYQAHYTTDKRTEKQSKDNHQVRWIALLFCFGICTALAILIGLTIDGSVYSVFSLFIAGLFAGLAIFFLVLLIIALTRGA